MVPLSTRMRKLSVCGAAPGRLMMKIPSSTTRPCAGSFETLAAPRTSTDAPVATDRKVVMKGGTRRARRCSGLRRRGDEHPVADLRIDALVYCASLGGGRQR